MEFEFTEDAFHKAVPSRRCQALDHQHLPEHPAEVVCNRDGLQWFSCCEHTPKDVSTENIEDFFIRNNILETKR